MITWTILAKCRGYFVIGRQEHVTTTVKPHPALRQLAIEPLLDEQRRETGDFELAVDFEVDDSTAEATVAELARDLFDGVLSMLAFSTGYHCFPIGRPSVRRPGPNEGAYRQLFFADALPLGPFGAGQMGPPPVLDETILDRPLTDEQQLLLGWWRRALETPDYVDSCTALFAALEPIAMQFPCDATRTETCPACGNKQQLAAGTGQRVKAFLVSLGGLSETAAEEVWEFRNAMSHGRIARTAAQRRRIAELRHSLITAISKGLRLILGTDTGGMPVEPEGGFRFSDAFLAVDFTVPREADNLGNAQTPGSD